MGGSASYRYGKKIANARANGASQEEIDELERQRQEAIAREKVRKAERMGIITQSSKSILATYGAKKTMDTLSAWDRNSSGRSSGQKFESELAPEGKGIVGALTNKKRNEQIDQFSKDKIVRISENIYDNLSGDEKKWAINDGEVDMKIDERTKLVTFSFPETITGRDGQPFTYSRHPHGIMEGDVKNLGLDNDYRTKSLTGQGLGDFGDGYDLARAITKRLKQKLGGKYTISLESPKAIHSRRASFVIKDESGKERRVFYEHNPYQDTEKIKNWVDKQF